MANSSRTTEGKTLLTNPVSLSLVVVSLWSSVAEVGMFEDGDEVGTGDAGSWKACDWKAPGMP